MLCMCVTRGKGYCHPGSGSLAILKCLNQDLRAYENHIELAMASMLHQSIPKEGGEIQYSIDESQNEAVRLWLLAEQLC